tara:strand:+ start:370 stop:1356 length:987 start_codon:yes stop_codon:yes gene_type:complete
MFEVKLKDSKTFTCESSETIFQGAKRNGILLEHSCLTARCKSCRALITKGQVENIQDEFVLSSEEKELGYILSCNAKPCSDLELDVEDLGSYNIPDTKTIPAKIDAINYFKGDVVQIVFRSPPAQKLNFLSGQYVNIIKGDIKRSYSIANSLRSDGKLEFLIKNYPGGVMSNYWFNEATVGDLLRIEGPLGTFFLRNLVNVETVIFLATGTGIAPIKAILEKLAEQEETLKTEIYLFWGGRFTPDFFWEPKFKKLNLKYIPVLSRTDQDWTGNIGYVQDAVIQQNINLTNAQVYACGSEAMINTAQKLLTDNGLQESNFYSDAFVISN